MDNLYVPRYSNEKMKKNIKKTGKVNLDEIGAIIIDSSTNKWTVFSINEEETFDDVLMNLDARFRKIYDYKAIKQLNIIGSKIRKFVKHFDENFCLAIIKKHPEVIFFDLLTIQIALYLSETEIKKKKNFDESWLLSGNINPIQKQVLSWRYQTLVGSKKERETARTYLINAKLPLLAYPEKTGRKVTDLIVREDNGNPAFNYWEPYLSLDPAQSNKLKEIYDPIYQELKKLHNKNTEQFRNMKHFTLKEIIDKTIDLQSLRNSYINEANNEIKRGIMEETTMNTIKDYYIEKWKEIHPFNPSTLALKITSTITGLGINKIQEIKNKKELTPDQIKKLLNHISCPFLDSSIELIHFGKLP